MNTQDTNSFSLHNNTCINYRIAGKFGRGEFTLFKHLAKKVWRINRSTNRLLVVSTNLDGFRLTNDGQFVKFAKHSPTKLSRYMV